MEARWQVADAAPDMDLITTTLHREKKKKSCQRGIGAHKKVSTSIKTADQRATRKLRNPAWFLLDNTPTRTDGISMMPTWNLWVEAGATITGSSVLLFTVIVLVSCRHGVQLGRGSRDHVYGPQDEPRVRKMGRERKPRGTDTCTVKNTGREREPAEASEDNA